MQQPDEVPDSEQPNGRRSGAGPDGARFTHGRAMPKVVLAGVLFDAATEAEVVDHVMDELAQGRGGRILTPNVDILFQLQRGSRRRALEGNPVTVPDGMPLVWASRLQGTPFPERVSGASLVWSLGEAAAREGRSVYLLGGSPGAAEAAARALTEKFAGLKIAGLDCPPYGFEGSVDQLALIEARVRAAQPDLVYVALGFPKQELLAQRLAVISPTTWFLGCGAALSFAGDVLRRAPLWTQHLGLEWVHRMAQEPRRLTRRYIVDDLPFAVLLLLRALSVRVRRSSDGAIGRGGEHGKR